VQHSSGNEKRFKVGRFRTALRPKIAPATEKAIRAALSKGDAGMHRIVARFGVGTFAGRQVQASRAEPPATTAMWL
jgi:hypothetical protein